MASALSDDELRRKLQEIGENVGPITKTTRKVWEKKLDSAMQEQKRNRNRTITRSNTSHLGHFSSDDSEDALCTETSQNHRHRYRRRRTIGSNQPSESSPNQSDSNIEDNITFKIPDSPATKTLNKSTYKSNTSPSRYISGLTRPSVRTVQRSNNSKLNSFDIDSSDSDVGPDHPRRSGRKGVQPEKTSGIDDSINSTLTVDWNNSIRKDEQFYNGNRKEMQLSTGLNHISAKANGFANEENTLWNTFKTDDDKRITTNYSQWISMFLVIVAALFFVIVGILYVGVRQKDLASSQSCNLVPFSAKTGDENIGGTEKGQANAQKIAWKLYTLLAETTGEYQCNERLTPPRLLMTDIKSKFREQEADEERPVFEDNYMSALEIIKNHFQRGIKLYDRNGGVLTKVESVSDIYALEAVIASKSLRCRLKQAFLQSSIELLCGLCVLLAIVGAVFFMKAYKRRKLLEEKKMYAVVENIIDILKQHSEKCQGNTDCEPVLAISHVRDMLIPPAERKLHQQLWDKAVKFLEENDSRVRVERQHIAGEDYKVWRWLQPSTPEIGGKYGKVWQGQAFGNTGKGINTLPFSPTPCLKIRNMFDPEVEYGDDWQVFITDAILEKCENNNNIVHIKVDVSSNEGCVYLKCTTSEAAGQAHRALHGWWFDRRLVTVKYLRLERYHERFPESKNCVAPLKPSNNMRLSLSAPFHSSALESS